MKRIGIDLHVVDGIFQGSRTHVLELFSRVIAISPDFKFYLFLNNINELGHFSDAFYTPNVHIVRMPYTNPVKRLCWQLPVLQKKYRLDLLHTQYIIPMPSFSPCVVTIHDLLFESHPQYFNSVFKLRSRLLMRWAARNSKHVFTVSEYSRHEITSRYKVKADKITVIYNAIDNKRFFPGNAGQEIIKQRNLSIKGYILTVGRLEPRKNHKTLLKAYAKLPVTTCPLVIIGQRDFDFDSVFALAEKLGIKKRVIFLDNINDSELPAFYRHALLFVYPSWAEGFGLPILEAMASGVPVITSNTTSLPEVVGNAGYLVNPGSVKALKNAMLEIICDNNLYKYLSAEGLARAECFSWNDTAAKVRDAYKKIMDLQK